MRSDRIVPLIIAVALFMENMDSTVIATSLPAIAADIGTNPLALKLAVTSYLLSLAIFIPASGWTADRFGARTVLAPPFRFDGQRVGATSPPPSIGEHTAAVLRDVIETVLEVQAELGIGAYELFSLRDADGGASGLYHLFGIMTDEYEPKPAFDVFRELIAL